MKNLLKPFLQSLENDDKEIMEAVMNGFHVIFEGYADVRGEERPDALTQFSQMAASTALNQGNPVLAFLQNSSAKLNDLYSYDDEPELDSFQQTINYEPTADDDYNNIYVKGNRIPNNSLEDSFGLTARDIAYDKSDDDSWANDRWNNSMSDWDDLAD
jgi:hypothetical protein